MFPTGTKLKILLVLLSLQFLGGCTAIAVTGAVVGTAASLAVEVVEVPFEVAGATYDLVTDDDEDEEDEEDEDS